MARALATPAPIDSDVIFFDESRVASKQVLLVHLWACGRRVAGNPQEMPDQSAALTPSTFAASLEAVASPAGKAAKAAVRAGRKKDGYGALACCAG
eukprot:10077717-Alexandrium_andersonii.AAC.1